VRSALSLLVTAIAWGLVGTSAGAHEPAHAKRAALTILISLDGFRSEYLDRGETPTLQSLAKEGVRSSMEPAFPSLTFPNHTTLLTGLYPDHHGVVANTFEDATLGKSWRLNNRESATDPDLWRVAAPLWATAVAQGVRSGAIFWPIVGVDKAGKAPALLQPLDAKAPAASELATLFSWLDQPETRRPRLIFLYFGRVDGVGHQFGPVSPQMDAVLAETDAAIGQLMDGLRSRRLAQSTNIIVVADHGMTGISKDRLVELDTIVPLSQVRIVTMGALAGVAPRPGFETAVDEALLGRHGHMQCWLKNEVPAQFHYGANPRVPPIVCLADLGWEIVTKGAAPFWPGSYRGDHGFDPREPDMAAMFVAHGPAFRRGVVWPRFPSVDVYALTAAVAGVRAEPSDGRLSDVAGMTTSLVRPPRQAITGTSQAPRGQDRLGQVSPRGDRQS
jgi:predicted AlkP superfamily pyrophosphatase or phosphodiesterase